MFLFRVDQVLLCTEIDVGISLFVSFFGNYDKYLLRITNSDVWSNEHNLWDFTLQVKVFNIATKFNNSMVTRFLFELYITSSFLEVGHPGCSGKGCNVVVDNDDVFMLILNVCRSWYGWFEGHLNIHEMIIPDVSRVSRRQFMGLTENVDFIKAYFNRPRVTSRSVVFFLQYFVDRWC